MEHGETVYFLPLKLKRVFCLSVHGDLGPRRLHYSCLGAASSWELQLCGVEGHQTVLPCCPCCAWVMGEARVSLDTRRVASGLGLCFGFLLVDPTKRM